MSATVKDLLMSAEYVLAEGNKDVVLVERGVRSFEDSTRNMLDMSAVPNVKGQIHLPIIVDPCHATGRPDLIPSMCRAVGRGRRGRRSRRGSQLPGEGAVGRPAGAVAAPVPRPDGRPAPARASRALWTGEFWAAEPRRI